MEKAAQAEAWAVAEAEALATRKAQAKATTEAEANAWGTADPAGGEVPETVILDRLEVEVAKDQTPPGAAGADLSVPEPEVPNTVVPEVEEIQREPAADGQGGSELTQPEAPPVGGRVGP